MIASVRSLVIVPLLALTAVSVSAQQPAAPRPAAAVPTAAEAQRFITRAEKELAELSVKVNRADWVANNFIPDDTEELTAGAQEAYAVATQKLALEAGRYDRVRLPADVRRKFTLLRLSLAA